MCLSDEVFAEYYEVANRERFAKYKEFHAKANKLLKLIGENAIWFKPIEEIRILPDGDDDKFLELAVAADASYIITGNSNDFVITMFREIKIYSPRQFYEEWMMNM